MCVDFEVNQKVCLVVLSSARNILGPCPSAAIDDTFSLGPFDWSTTGR